MPVQEDLKAVTEDLSIARLAHMEAEVALLVQRRRVNDAETALQTARIALMSRAEAGTNEVARRAYAERETAADREGIIEIENELVEIEQALITAQAILDSALDQRRYLETIVTLAVNRAANDTLHAAYADNGDRDSILPTFDGDDNLPF